LCCTVIVNRTAIDIPSFRKRAEIFIDRLRRKGSLCSLVDIDRGRGHATRLGGPLRGTLLFVSPFLLRLGRQRRRRKIILKYGLYKKQE
jgi:hypothetical protein